MSNTNGNSLTLNGLEVVGYSQNPEYHLGAHTNSGLGSGLDFGEILPDTDVISSRLLDGDVISGDRTGNRTWNFVVVVQGTSRTDLATKVDTLLKAINADTYQVIWTPKGCAASVFTAYRATFSVAKDFNKNRQLVAEVTVSFQTKPFATSFTPLTPSSSGGGTTHGYVDVFTGIQGSARTPVAIALDLSGSAFNNVLLHSPPQNQDANLTILSALVSNVATIASANMKFDGTYSIVALLSASATGPRTITAQVTQKVGSTPIATQIISTLIPGLTADGMVAIGEVTLPLIKLTAENSVDNLQISITSTSGTDAFSDVALCDTEGQTIMATHLITFSDSFAGANCKSVYLDLPDPLTGVGGFYGSTTTDRTAAVSQLRQALISGGPILFEPGTNKLLVACTSGLLSTVVTYSPAWLDEALS